MIPVHRLKSPCSLKLLAALATLPAGGFLATMPLRADEIIDSGPAATLGTAGSYTLSGSGSTLTIAPGADLNADTATDDLIVGHTGTGSLTVTDGATLSVPGAAFGNLVLGGGSGSTGSLTVSAGGALSSIGLYVGGRPDATGTLLVTGTGSSLASNSGGWGVWVSSPTSTATITAGASLTSAHTDNGVNAGSLTVSAGGTLTTGYADNNDSHGTFSLDTTGIPFTYAELGLTAPASLSASVLVTGAGSTWNNTGALHLLGSSSADTVSLTVTDHAALNHVGYIGLSNAAALNVSDGATVTLSNPTAYTSLAPNLYLDGGSLSLASGASVTGVAGTFVGYNNVAGTLNVFGGASLTTQSLNVGYGADGFYSNEGSALLITGTGSVVNITGTGSGNTDLNGSITITDGGALHTAGLVNFVSDATISAGGSLISTYAAGSLGNELSADVLVTGAGSTLGLAKSLLITSSVSASLTIADHASFTSTAGLTIGAFSPGSFSVTSGATASTVGVGIGSFATSNGAVTNAGHATVTGAGSVWTNTGSLTLGTRRNGDLTVSAGGVLNNTGNVTLGAIGGVTATATVTGPGSRLNATGTLTVGHSGAPVGRLTIADHGRVSASSVVVNSGFADGGYLEVGGLGQLAAASVTVNSGGTLIVHDQAVFAFDLGAPSLDAPIDFLSGTQMPVDTDAIVYLYLHNQAGFAPGDYALFSFDAASSQSGIGTATFAVATDFGGYAYSVAVTSLGITLTVSEAPGALAYSVDGLTPPSTIPEPAGFAALAGLATLGLAASRRRRA